MIVELFEAIQGTVHEARQYIERSIEDNPQVEPGQSIAYRLWPTRSFDVWVYKFGHGDTGGGNLMWLRDAFGLGTTAFHIYTKSVPAQPEAKPTHLRVVK